MKKNVTKKIAAVVLMATMCIGLVTGCGSEAPADDTTTDQTTDAPADAEATVNDAAISVISREDGSGTRGAFVELMGILEDDVDNTTASAEITNSTSVMMTTVAGNKDAIGYVSLGSLSSDVKAVQVDGVDATVENIVNGSYTVSRPFNIVTGEIVTELAQDFINYILSDDGQAVISGEGYIPVSEGQTYEAAGLSGTISLAGSTSVAPVMEVLAEQYMALNPEVTIEIQQSGSSAGITSTIEGACDIGMSSRELKDSETSEGVAATRIAMDGIAVIVNNENAVTTLTSEQIKNIFTGAVTNWSEVQ